MGVQNKQIICLFNFARPRKRKYYKLPVTSLMWSWHVKNWLFVALCSDDRLAWLTPSWYLAKHLLSVQLNSFFRNKYLCSTEIDFNRYCFPECLQRHKLSKTSQRYVPLPQGRFPKHLLTEAIFKNFESIRVLLVVMQFTAILTTK